MTYLGTWVCPEPTGRPPTPGHQTETSRTQGSAWASSPLPPTLPSPPGHAGPSSHLVQERQKGALCKQGRELSMPPVPARPTPFLTNGSASEGLCAWPVSQQAGSKGNFTPIQPEDPLPLNLSWRPSPPSIWEAAVASVWGQDQPWGWG